MLQDFRKFITRGNVIDLAVAVVIGGAFGRIVSSLVNDILMPFLGLLLGRIDFRMLRIVIRQAKDEAPELAILYGQFIQNIVDFLIIAFAIFLMIRLLEKTKKKPEPAKPAPPPAPPADVQLLTEIRDLLRQKD